MDDFDIFSPGVDPDKPPRGKVEVAPEMSGLDAIREAIARNETGHIAAKGGDPYAALGPKITRKSGFVDQALGRYGVMRSNLPDWSKKAFGKPLTEKEFLADKELQDQLFNHRFGSYLMSYAPEDAAAMWFSGRPLGKARHASDGHWTTEQYVKNFQKNASGVTGKVSAAPDDMEMFAPGGAVPQEYLDTRTVPPAATPQRAELPPQEIASKAPWGLPQAALYGATLGFSPQIASAFGADPDAMRKARSAYRVDYPEREALGEVAGSLAPAMLGAGAGMAGIAAAGRALPALGPAAEFLGGYAGEHMGGLGGFALRRASDVAHGAVQGGLQGVVTSPLGQGSVGNQGAMGAAVGAVTGPFLSGIIGRPISRATRNAVGPAEQGLFQEAESRGIPLYAQQLTDNPLLKAIPVDAENQMAQVGAFNKALAKGVGEDLPQLTDVTLGQAKQNRWNEIAQILSSYDLPMTPGLSSDLKTIWQSAKANLVDPKDLERIGNTLTMVAKEAVAQGGMPGKRFQDMVSKGGLVHNLQKDNHLGHFGTEIKRALNRAFEDLIPAGHPDKGKLALLKQQYALAKKIEKPIEKAAPSMVSPKAIHGVGATNAPVPQELKTLAQIAKYLPQVDSVGALKGAERGHYRLLGGLGLLGAGGIAGHEYIQHAWEHLPPAIKDSLLASGVLGLSLAAGKMGGKYMLQNPTINKMLVNGQVPSLPLSYNPAVSLGNQLGTKE